MLDDTRKYFADLLRKYPDNPSKIVEDLIDKMGGLEAPTDKMVGVFSMCKKLGIRLVAIDYKADVAQFVKRGTGKKSYIFLNSTSNIRRLRFDAATMLYCALRSEKNGKEVVTKSIDNHNLHRAKRFAATLLMPTKSLKETIYERDESGEYKYLVKVGEEWVIPFKNIHYIADIYGVEFTACAKRILHSKVVPIRRIKDKHELKKRLEGPQASEATRKELIPDWETHDYALKCCLINNMHFPSIDTANDVVKEKIRVESVKNECVIEGVVSSTRGMDKFLHKYRVNPEAMKEEIYKLSISQRIMLGHYETLLNLQNIPFSKYFLNDLHKSLFQYAPLQPGESEWLDDPAHFRASEVFIDFVPGAFRRSANIVNGATYQTDDPFSIYYTIDGLYWHIQNLLDNKDKFSNIDYINYVNYIADRFIVCHPFEDGNGRVSRLLMNYLLHQKNLPIVFINATTRKKAYIDALNELRDQSRYLMMENIDFTKLNNIVIDGLIETEGIFFSAKAMTEDPDKTIDAYKVTK